MKTIRHLLIASLILAASAALASDKDKAEASQKQTKAKQPAKATLTGSYLKQNARQAGLITSGVNNVVVLDTKMIQTSGAADVAQLLRHKGFRR